MAGGLLCGTGFALSLFSQNVAMMIVLYGLVGGSGLGLMYVPTIISVNYYFDKKRSIANGKTLVDRSQHSALDMGRVSKLLIYTQG